MHPPIFVVDHRIGPGPAPVFDGHQDRPKNRRHAPQRLEMTDSRHSAPFSPAMGVVPDVPEPVRQRALLIALANDPRFQRARPTPRASGIRVRLGRLLMAIGWRLIDAGRGQAADGRA